MVAVALGVAQGRAPRGWLGWDLAAFRVAGKVFASGKPIYDFSAQAAAYHAEYGKGFDVLYPFAYPPIFAIETLPLSWMPHEVAYALVAIASLLSASVVMRKLTGDARDVVWITATLPGMLALLAGQFSLIALGLVTACHALLKKERPIAAGLVLSLLAFKPQLLLFVPALFVIRRDARRALVGLAAGLAAQVALCFAIAPRDTLAFPAALRTFNAYVASKFTDDLAFTWRAFFALLAPGHAPITNALAACAIVACAAFGVVSAWRARADLDRCFAILVLTTLACAWHASAYDWVILALPIVVLVPRASPSRAESIALGIAYVASWGFVSLSRAEHDAFGHALHFAMPALAVFAFWAVRRTTGSSRVQACTRDETKAPERASRMPARRRSFLSGFTAAGWPTTLSIGHVGVAVGVREALGEVVPVVARVLADEARLLGAGDDRTQAVAPVAWPSLISSRFAM